jgi:hypothetical protein
MSALNRMINPLRQAAAAFFKHDVALKRQAEGLQIVLEARAPEPKKLKPKDARLEAARQKEKHEQALVVDQLAALLAEYPEARTTLRHLVFVESSVRKKGLKILHKLPLDVMQRALEQLEGLVTNWSPEGLANLRSKMAVAILDREHMDADAEADNPRTAAVLDSGAQETTLPPPPAAGLPEEDSSASDDDALAAAYAALGAMAPSGEIELQGELGSRSAKAVATPLPRVTESAGEIELRVLQD